VGLGVLNPKVPRLLIIGIKTALKILQNQFLLSSFFFFVIKIFLGQAEIFREFL
jgi:hypothetical protein